MDRAVSHVRHRWPLGVVGALAAIAPFNVKPTTQAWTDLQLRPLVFVSLLGVVVLVGRELRRRAPDLIDTLAYVWLAAVWMSALLSNSVIIGVGGAVRLSVAILLIPVIRGAVASVRDELVVLRSLAAGATAGALVGLAIWLFRVDADGTEIFVGQVTRLGPFNRLTRPWSHANVAAMALGMSIASAAVLPNRWVRFGSLATMTIALVLTVSRGGLLSAAVAATVWLGMRRRRSDSVLVASLVAVAAVVFVLSAAWSIRADQPDDGAFYASSIRAPTALEVDESARLVQVTIANQSRSTWLSGGAERVLISARWIGPDGLVWTEDRWSLPADLAPGQELTAPLTIGARLPAGEYQVRWDLMIDRVAYFGQFLGEPPVMSLGTVTSSAVSLVDIDSYDLVERPVGVGRVRGWELALDDFASSPFVGVGPNQFGDRAAVELISRGESVGSHAHNIVLEPLAAWGLFGSLPFFALGSLALKRALTRAWRTRTRQAVAVAAGLCAAAAHGLVDWPLVVITTGMPLGMLAGLALAEHAES